MSTAVLGAKGLPRGPYYDTREHEAGVSLDGLRDPALHTIRRKPWARGMNSTAMKYYEDLVRSQVGELARAFHQREGEKVDISAWMTFFGFSYGFGMLQNGRDVHGLSDLIERALTEAAWISHVPWSIPFLGYIPGGSTSWEEMKVAGEQAVKRRVDGGSIHPDLFHYLMDEDGVEPIKPSLETCAIDGQLAIIAGSDTAATALAHLWYFLLSQPQCFNRLRKEVDDAFPPGEDSLMDLARQGAMPYLNACINESLRLYPPVLTGLQRRVVSGTGGRMVGPHFVPDGTQVAAWAYSIHRDPKHFSPLPNAFWPDRWLSQEKFVLPSGEAISQDQVITERDVFLPFSLGPMVCAGKNVAMTEMRAVVCAVMQQFDIEIADRSCVDSWEDDVHEIFVTSRGTLPVLLKSRSLPTLI
ncbi:hypothetical protein EW026_g2323 [Hermanssonia centrifuga]|uniref:Cytochrome P450 n=1 Tax=Hermanssonia centrifuga TaxID=98765 RepID=A0A4S4KNP3_9APHY|nr:hypothetical protein EW026_g2323 [Hermanssonia centrifuga]